MLPRKSMTENFTKFFQIPGKILQYRETLEKLTNTSRMNMDIGIITINYLFYLI